MKENESEVAQLCPTLCDPMDCSLHQAPPSMGFSRQGYRVGCHFLLQGIFLIQGLNLGIPHCRQTLYHLSHQGSHFFPRDLRNNWYCLVSLFCFVYNYYSCSTLCFALNSSYFLGSWDHDGFSKTLTPAIWVTLFNFSTIWINHFPKSSFTQCPALITK